MNDILYKDTFVSDIHLCQNIFKTLTMALSFPGSIRQLSPRNIPNVDVDYSYVLHPLLALLDLETTHTVYSSNSKLKKAVSNYLEANTNSSLSDPEEADFILCLDPSLRSIFASIKRGTLAAPNTGASVIYHVNKLSSTDENNCNIALTLKGPGVKDAIHLAIGGLKREEPTLWQASRRDYPLGIDLFLVSTSGEIVGIPRSVSIIQHGVS